MLQFYFDFLNVVLPFESFELLEMDTDSLYFALSEETIDEAVPTSRKTVFEKKKKKFLVINEDEDRRTPGLFKLEWKGTGMICLCSKTYFAFSTSTDSQGNEVVENVKLSSKGISKRANSLKLE